MKKCYFLLFWFLIFCTAAFGQQSPMGMKYQAVARDLKGAVLSDQQITLKITLAGNNGQSWSTYYSETHQVQTSQLGLFTLVVGDGTVSVGKFAEIPWSSEDIWMEVAIKDNSGFAVISNSRLLAVPFAFHALTANQLVHGDEVRSPGVPSQNWSLFGNSSSNPLNDALGVTDYVDLVIITNNIDRLRILANGNVLLRRSLDIGANLKVDSNVVLNDKMGSTVNNGPFTVARNSPTLLSGTLTVDLATDLNASLNVDGPTDLNSNLNVNNQKPTKLTGTLQVNGVTTLKDTTYVADAKPTILTGHLRVDSTATFKHKLVLDNPAFDQDTASLVPGGALQVAGGGGFGGNLIVAGSARIGGGLALGSLKVTDTTSSTSTTTGAATVAGGVGIAKQLNVGGKTVINNSMDINAGDGQVKIIGGLDGDDQNSAAYPLLVQGKKQGIEIKLTTVGTPENSNNFLTFKDKDNNVRGRVEGQTQGELNSDPWYRWDVTNYTLYVVWAGLDVVYAVGDLIAAISDFRLCVGLGVVVCPPSVGTIVLNVLVLAGKIVQLAQQIVNLAEYIINKNDNLGVTFSSGAGDYAEWLLKENPGLKMQPGQIIGVHRGLISLNTDGAERVLVVSTNPIVLGNNPDAGKESNYEKIAFLGQVPVRVTGKVQAGDYVLAGSKHDGTGIAKHPDDITIDDIPNIVGIAWTGADQAGEKAIKVAVGLTTNDLKNIVQKLEKKVDTHTSDLNDLKKQINDNNAMLAKLIPGFKATALPVENVTSKEPVKEPAKVGVTDQVVRNPVGDNQGQLDKAFSSISGLSVLNTKMDEAKMDKVKKDIIQLFGAKLNNPESDRFPVMTDALIDKLLEWGSDLAEQNGAVDKASNNSSVLLQKIKSDPQFKNFLYTKMKETYQQKMEEQRLINQQKK